MLWSSYNLCFLCWSVKNIVFEGWVYMEDEQVHRLLTILDDVPM